MEANSPFDRYKADAVMAKLDAQRALVDAPNLKPVDSAIAVLRPRPGRKLGDALFHDDWQSLNHQDLLDGWAEKGELTLLVGPEKSGKGRLLATLACAAAIPDFQFPGVKASKPLRTILILPEASSSMQKVLLAWGTQYKEHRSHLIERVSILDLQREGGAMLSEDVGRQTIEHELAEFESAGLPVDLMIVDSISLFTGGEQVDPKVVHAVCNNLKALAAKYGCGVIIAHHTNRGGNFEGSKMWQRHPSIIRRIEWTEGERDRFITYGPCRDRDGGETQKFTITPVIIDGENRPGFAIVGGLYSIDPDETPRRNKQKRAPRKTLADKLKEKALDILAETPAGLTSKELAVQLSKYHDGKGSTKSKLEYCQDQVKTIRQHADVQYDSGADTLILRKSDAEAETTAETANSAD